MLKLMDKKIFTILRSKFFNIFPYGQGWNLDMDEKSKATIEKMLLEEQQYLSGKSSKPRRNLQSKGRLLSSPGKSANSISPSARRLWSDQEKQMLLKGVVSFHGIFSEKKEMSRDM